MQNHFPCKSEQHAFRSWAFPRDANVYLKLQEVSLQKYQINTVCLQRTNFRLRIIHKEGPFEYILSEFCTSQSCTSTNNTFIHCVFAQTYTHTQDKFVIGNLFIFKLVNFLSLCACCSCHINFYKCKVNRYTL